MIVARWGCVRGLVAAAVLTVAFASPAAAATPSGFSPVPSPALATGTLFGVDASGPNDAWAVGSGLLVGHWNGTAWSRVKLPEPWGSSPGILFDVLAFSPTNVWAVGEIGPLGQRRALVIHRSAAGWVKYTLNQIPADAGQTQLFGIGGSAGNLWAVGGRNDAQRPIALHFTGSSWQFVTPPSPPRDNLNYLQAVRAIGPSNVWFVGNLTTDGPGNSQRPWSFHWNGSSFGSVEFLTQPFPMPPNEYSAVMDLDAVGTVPIAVGSAANSSNIAQAAIWRRSSGTWNPTTPFSDPTSRRLNSVQAVGASNIWSVGERLTAAGEQRTWIVHWNGSSWVSLGGPNPRTGGSALNGISSVPGSATLWAVGDSGGTPLILRRN